MEEPKAARTKKTNKLVEISEEDSNPFGGMVSKGATSSVAAAATTSNNLPQMMTFDFGSTANNVVSVNECTNDAARDKLMGMNQ